VRAQGAVGVEGLRPSLFNVLSSERTGCPLLCYCGPSMTIVGLPDTAVQEAKERVRSAIRNCGLTFPQKRITVNLAPADIRKEGPAYGTLCRA